MNPIPHPSQPAHPTIQTRHELDAVVENVVQLQLERAALERDQEQEIAAVRQRFRMPLAELDAAELRKCGVKIVQEERFFIAPHGPSTIGSGTAGENEWKEAA